MKRFLTATLLGLVISISAMAGDVPSGDFVAPPPPPNHSSSTTEPTTVLDQQPLIDSQQILEPVETALFAVLSMLMR